MYSYSEKKANSAAVDPKPIHKPLTTTSNMYVVQRMLSRIRSASGHSREWHTAKSYLLSTNSNHYGRSELYNFSYSQEVLNLLRSNMSANPADPNTIDHKIPLCRLFNDNWPDTLYRSYREEQYNDISNIQILPKSQNSSKGSRIRGSGIEVYDQRKAIACMVYERLGCPSLLDDILIDYGYGAVDAHVVLKKIADIYDEH